MKDNDILHHIIGRQSAKEIHHKTTSPNTPLLSKIVPTYPQYTPEEYNP